MARYRCYFFGSHGQLVGAETILEENDAEATRVARRLYAQRAHAAGFDLRQGKRLVDAHAHDSHASGASRAA